MSMKEIAYQTIVNNVANSNLIHVSSEDLDNDMLPI